MAHRGAERVLIPCEASGTINAGYGVKLNSTSGGKIIVEECDSAGEFCFGIAEETVSDGDHVTVCVWGRTKALTGADPTFGAGVTVAADGTVTDAEVDYYIRRSKGVGTVITACAYATPNGKGFHGEFGSDNDAMIPSLHRLAKAIQDSGAKAILQVFLARPQNLAHEAVVDRELHLLRFDDDPPSGKVTPKPQGHFEQGGTVPALRLLSSCRDPSHQKHGTG